jgi:IS5 family transposase
VPNRDPDDPDLVERFKTTHKGKAIRKPTMKTTEEHIWSIVRGKTVRLHALFAVESKLVVAAIITDVKAHESPYLRELVGEALKTHMIHEVAADRGYDSDENAAFLAERHIRNIIIAVRPLDNTYRLRSRTWQGKFRYGSARGDFTDFSRSNFRKPQSASQ